MTASETDRCLVGVDIGGTFTDCVVMDPAGNLSIGKASSTPPNFERGFLASLQAGAEKRGMSAEDLASSAQGIFHGCTVGTNALVEKRTSKVGLLTSAGHADSLFFMQGGHRLVGSDPRYIARIAGQTKPEPLVPKHLVREVHERSAVDGHAVVPFNESQCREAIAELLAEGVEAFAVAFLWSTANPRHEQMAVSLIHEMAPDAFVSASAEVVPRPGEYQRTVATVINSLIGPVTSAYLLTLEKELASLGYSGQLKIMSCSGGLIDAAVARRLPVFTIGSGPVAGLIGAGKLARWSARDEGSDDVHVLTGDMGGTTFDVGVIRHGEPLSRATTKYGEYEYFTPTLDVRSIGAGGGSIVHYDELTEVLRVGPRSAGAIPGPAAYLAGGNEATVTDADLVLGYLNPENFLGGRMALGLDAAREALSRAGAPLGFSAEETAAAAARIVDSQMADAIRLASVQQGYDPRTYTMYAYGGAGAVHCPAVARQLGIERLLIPMGDLASGWSAFGVASSDALVVQEAPVVMQAPFDPVRMNEVWEEMYASVLRRLEQQDLADSELVWSRGVDIRYSLQVNEVPVSAPPGVYDQTTADGLVTAFEREYERIFGEGSGHAGAGFTLTGMRMSARAKVSSVELGQQAGLSTGPASSAEPVATRDVIWYAKGLEAIPTPVYDGAHLQQGDTLDGPAIVEFTGTTLALGPEQSASLDAQGSIVVDA